MEMPAPVERIVWTLGIPGEEAGMPSKPMTGERWHVELPEVAHMRKPLAVTGPPKWYLDFLESRKQRLPIDCVGPDGSRTIYHTSMGRMMGVRGG